MNKMKQFLSKRLAIGLLTLLMPMIVLAQDITVQGTVTDEAGETLIGATVQQKGTSNGTVTDFDGNFTLTVPSNAILSVSYIGYTPKEIAVNGQTNLTIVLSNDDQMLNEVVVIGYGTMDKKELTSAISHVSEKDFLTVSSLDPSMMIQGKVAGVSITNTGTGDPNNQASIQIRGVSSRSAGLGPLIVIDGFQGGKLSDISPNDIEDISVLYSLPMLHYLTMSGNRIRDISPVLEMKELKWLEVTGNPIEDESVFDNLPESVKHLEK